MSLPRIRLSPLRRYTQNGVLEMLERNAGIKSHPQRWQEQTKRFDIVVTFEKEVFNDVLDGKQPTHTPHINTLLARPPAPRRIERQQRARSRDKHGSIPSASLWLLGEAYSGARQTERSRNCSHERSAPEPTGTFRLVVFRCVSILCTPRIPS